MKSPLPFLAANPWIIRGLLSGAFTRFGGAIRSTATGKVIAFLLDPPNPGERVLSDSVRTILSGASAWERLDGVFTPEGDAARAAKSGEEPSEGASAEGSRRSGFGAAFFAALPKDLTKLLQLSQVSAISDCLGLGVSVAGFGYLGWRLHQVQRTLGELQTGLRAANGKLDTVLEKLDLLTLVSLDHGQKLDALRHAVEGLRHDEAFRDMTALGAALATRAQFPETPAHGVFEKAAHVEALMKTRSQRITPGDDAEALLFASLTAPAWASATAAAGQCLLSSGKGDAALRHMREEAQLFRAFAESWAGALLRDPESSWQTAFRFQTQVFRGKIRRERVTRIARISPYDKATPLEQHEDVLLDAETESRMSHRRAEVDSAGFVDRQEKVADFLDGLSETADRLDTLADYAAYWTGTRAPELNSPIRSKGSISGSRSNGLATA